MHPWEKTYRQDEFAITTQEPSVIVKTNSNLFSTGDKVFDIGCGNGRNAIFLAEKGCEVDAIDIADLNWTHNLDDSVKKHIRFQKINLDDFKWDKKYDGIILARVIQYVSPDVLGNLIRNIHAHLTDSGILLLSYTTKGGIRNRPEIDVPKFSHDIEKMRKLLEKYFSDVQISQGATRSVHVKFDEPLESYDIKCIKAR